MLVSCTFLNTLLVFPGCCSQTRAVSPSRGNSGVMQSGSFYTRAVSPALPGASGALRTWPCSCCLELFSHCMQWLWRARNSLKPSVRAEQPRNHPPSTLLSCSCCGGNVPAVPRWDQPQLQLVGVAPKAAGSSNWRCHGVTAADW